MSSSHNPTPSASPSRSNTFKLNRQKSTPVLRARTSSTGAASATNPLLMSGAGRGSSPIHPWAAGSTAPSGSGASGSPYAGGFPGSSSGTIGVGLLHNPLAAGGGAKRVVNTEAHEKVRESLVSLTAALGKAMVPLPQPGEDALMRAAKSFAATETVIERTGQTLARCQKSVGDLQRVTDEELMLFYNSVTKGLETLRF
ncbi:hypothetical protein HDU96_000741 [Phlyctochytrium bullatum]|nr:hypothetical protein HDU96_000741 [Phlyctochytrium bullatum]